MTVIVQNLADAVPESLLVGLNQAAIDRVVNDIANAARTKWIKIAQKELSTTSRDYVNGIQPVVMRPGVAIITLVGQLPNLLEHGQEQYDLHDTLLGPKVPVVAPGSRGKHARKKGGYYRAVPFRHATPGTIGAVGKAMGAAYEGHHAVKDAKALGKRIHKAAKQLVATKSEPGNKKLAYGGRLPEGLAPKLKGYHATDIYAGMLRQEKTYEKATQNQYVTFRTIAVDASGKGVGSSPWIRKKTPAKNFHKQVQAFVQKIAPQAFSAYLESLA